MKCDEIYRQESVGKQNYGFSQNKSYIFAHKRLTYIIMEQKKTEYITLHLIVFGTIIIIGVLARQTALHYGWDEFSSYLIFMVCSIVIGAIYLNLQWYSANSFHQQ